ncbi:MAG: hypothetical protein N2C14_08430, partial [Planctomycetales bacterium]
DDKFGQVIIQLSAFNEGLAALKDVMTTGMDGMDQVNSQRDEKLDSVIRELGGFNQSLQGVAESLGDVLPSAITTSFDDQTLDALKAVASKIGNGRRSGDAPTAGGKLPKRIQVINKVPDTIVHVLRSQFELMQSWMQPILQATNLQQSQVNQLQVQLRDALGKYDHLIRKVSTAPREDVKKTK